MGKALVLRNVNFSENKLGTVTFLIPVPCTGISLSSNTISFTSLGTSTLTATLTPSDTTDQIEWHTSDDTVATVVGGVVTAVGVGTATITATCGNQSATCSISVSVTLTTNDFAPSMAKAFHTTKTEFENGRDRLNLTTGTTKQINLASAIPTSSGYKAYSGDSSDYDGKYPIMIPKNAVSMTVDYPDQVTVVSVIYMDSTKHPTSSTTSPGTRIVAYPSSVWRTGTSVEITLPTGVDGLDSFVMNVSCLNDKTEFPDELTITFA